MKQLVYPIIRSVQNVPIEAEDMDEVIDRLKKHGIQILEGPNEIAGSEQWIYFADPDWNVLEYIVWLNRDKSGH